MTTAITCTMVLTAQLAVGGLGLFDCLLKKKDRHDYNGPSCCRSCESEYRTVHNLLVVLQRHSNWKERAEAAEDLREFDWRCHPELVPVLSASMLDDTHKKVRRKAAETLGKLSPCDPTAHVALQQAAVADPDHWVRKKARKALSRLDHRCLDDCSICGPSPTSGQVIVDLPQPALLEPGFPSSSRAPRIFGEVPFDPLAPGLPPEPFDTHPSEPGLVLPESEYPALPAPNARPGLLPPALPPSEEPVEVVPPELPPPAPPAASPFGTSHRLEERPRSRPQPDRPVRLFTIGRPR